MYTHAANNFAIFLMLNCEQQKNSWKTFDCNDFSYQAAYSQQAPLLRIKHWGKENARPR